MIDGFYFDRGKNIGKNQGEKQSLFWASIKSGTWNIPEHPGTLVIIRFRVQFGINLHESVFQKAEIARAASASAVSAY